MAENNLFEHKYCQVCGTELVKEPCPMPWWGSKFDTTTGKEVRYQKVYCPVPKKWFEDEHDHWQEEVTE